MIRGVSNRFCFIACSLLIVPLALVFLLVFRWAPPQHSPHSLSSPDHPIPSLHPDLGGAGNVDSQYPGDGQPILTKPRLGTPAGCVSSTDPGTALQVLWPSLKTHIADVYNNDSALLCLDKWPTVWTSLNCNQSMKSIFQVLGWPLDLLKSPYDGYIECVAPLTQGEISQLLTGVAATTTTPQTSSIANSCVWDLGDWIVVHPVIQICDFVNQLVKGVLEEPLQVAFQQVSSQTNSFLWQTPAALTYDNTTLLRFWTISLGIVTILLVIALSWAALRSMVRTTNWLSYANVVEFLPRIFFGILAAYGTLAASRLIIDASNALSTVFTNDMLTKLSQTQSDNPVTVFLQAIYITLCLLLVLEEAARLVVLYVLIGFGPIWAFSACLRETQALAKGGLKGLFIFALIQPMQNALIDMGQSVMGSLAGGSLNNSILQFLIAIGILLLALSLIFIAARSALGGMASPLAMLATGATAGLAVRTARYSVDTARRIFNDVGNTRRATPLTSTRGYGSPRTPLQRTASLVGHAAPHVGRAALYTGRAAFTIANSMLIEPFQPLSAKGPTRLKKVPSNRRSSASRRAPGSADRRV